MLLERLNNTSWEGTWLVDESSMFMLMDGWILGVMFFIVVERSFSRQNWWDDERIKVYHIDT